MCKLTKVCYNCYGWFIVCLIGCDKLKTIALRYSDNYAPVEGTIALHNKIIKEKGFVWYGKFGNSFSENVIKEVLDNKDSKILLLNNGFTDKYWAYISDIKKTISNYNNVPNYYKGEYNDIKCWIKINRIEKAENDVMDKCIVISSQKKLSDTSKRCMSPSFIIEYKEM